MDRIKINGAIIDELEYQKKGLQYTATGYGAKIPTRYKVLYNNRYYRVYCFIYSNSGNLYIISKKRKYLIDDLEILEYIDDDNQLRLEEALNGMEV